MPPPDAIEAGILTNCPLGFNEDKAFEKPRSYNKTLDAWRAGDIVSGKTPGTIGWLVDQYKRSSWYTSRKPKTRQGYDADLKRLEDFLLPSGATLGKFSSHPRSRPP